MTTRRTWNEWLEVAKARRLTAAERRQSRKAWGLMTGEQWRSLGNQAGRPHPPMDAMTRWILDCRRAGTVVPLLPELPPETETL